MAQFPSESVAQKSYDFRTLGLGYANLGSLLMVQGIPYDSPEGRAQCGGAHRPHARRLPTPRPPRSPPRSGRSRATRPTATPMLRVVRNHRRAAYNAAAGGVRRADHHARRHRRRATARPTCSHAARSECDRMLELGEKHGYRNAQVTCIAPTGTIGLVMDCDTTGVEPDFALVKFKKLAGGGYFKIINASIPPALATARLHAEADRRHRPLLPRRRHAARLPAHQPGQPQGQGLHRRGPRRRSRRSCPARSSCRSSSTAGRSATTSCTNALGFTAGAARGARLRPARRASASPASRSPRPTTTSAAP